MPQGGFTLGAMGKTLEYNEGLPGPRGNGPVGPLVTRQTTPLLMSIKTQPRVDENAAMQETTEPPAERLGKHRLDWLGLLSLVGLSPWLAIFCADLWFRSDFQFFPLLILASLGWTVWQGRATSTEGKRWPYVFALWIGGGLCGLLAGLLFAPWLAWLALVLVWNAWTVCRLGNHPWPRVVSWSLPLASLLALPLADATDPLLGFTHQVTMASSALLDLIAIPQLPENSALELRSGRLEISSLCRGLGNPYLLGALAVMYCLLTRPSLVLGLLTVLSVPVWAWANSVAVATLGSVLSEQFAINVLFGYRLWIVQGVVLLLAMLAVALFERGLRMLLSPFEAFAEGVGMWHKLYYRIVLWPVADPLRSRKSLRNAPTPEAMVGPSRFELQQRPQWWIGAVVLVVVGGAVAFYRVSSQASPTGQGWQLVSAPQPTGAEVDRRLEQKSMPEEWQGMRLVAFDARPARAATTWNSRSAQWDYAEGNHSIRVTVSLPRRGFFPWERTWTATGGETLEERQSVESTFPELSGVLIDEAVVSDPLTGPSFLNYATWSPAGPLPRSVEIGTQWSWSTWLSWLRYQPSTVSLSVFATGYVPADDDERARYRQLLVDAVQRFKQ